MFRFSGFRPSRIVLFLVTIFALSAFVYGCTGAQSGGSSDRGDSNVEEISAMTTNVEETAGTETGNASADEAGQADGSQDSNASGDAGIAITPENKVTVGLSGDEGVRFSGSCTVNGERERLKGTVPKSFDYGIEDGGTVKCVLKKRGGEGVLRITLDSPFGSSVQETNSKDDEVRIAMGGSATNSNSTSSSSSSSVTSSQSNSSVKITQNNDSSGGD